MMISILLSTFVMAQAPAKVPAITGTPPPVAGQPVQEEMTTIAAEVKKECVVKKLKEKNLAEVCMEGNKKICPKGYALKQKPLDCPPGKMCAQVMQDYCEKGATK